MNRPILIAIVGLTVVGCAEVPTAVPVTRNVTRLPPVELASVPNIYEAINRENTRIDPASLRPENGPVLANLGGSPAAASGSGSGPAAAPVAAPGNGQCAACSSGSGSAPIAAAPRSAANGTAAMRDPLPAPAPAPAPMPATASAPVALPAPEPVSADMAPPPPAGLPDAEISQTSSAAGEAAPTPLPEPAPMPEPAPVAPEPPPVINLEPAPAPEPPASAPAFPPEPALPSEPLPELPPGLAPDALPPAPSTGPEATQPVPVPSAETAAAPASGAVARSGPPAKPTADPNVARTSASPDVDPTAMHAEGSPVTLKEAGGAAARVGDEIITFNDLKVAVQERMANLPGNYKPNRQEINMIMTQVLDMLIERSTLIQEAKRELKKPEQLKVFMDVADKVWHDEELPPLLRKYSVENEYKLKEKLKEQGKSIDALREGFRMDFLARGYLEQKLKPRITVAVSEMRDYYNKHIDEYNRPEQWTWREVLVEFDLHKTRAEARSKAEAILARLRRGEDFAAVAKAESEGPNRSGGGRWETAPESYAVTEVNDTLRSLPIGQVSGIIEGPSSYHLVRVDSRRAAGPATFAEVQDKIRRIVHNEKAHKVSDEFLGKVRQRYVVTTVFDKTDAAVATTRMTPAPPPSAP